LDHPWSLVRSWS